MLTDRIHQVIDASLDDDPALDFDPRAVSGALLANLAVTTAAAAEMNGSDRETECRWVIKALESLLRLLPDDDNDLASVSPNF
jgi:hypothetical protein